MRTQGSLTLFYVRGIPIRAHWTLFLIIPYIATVFSVNFAEVANTAGVAANHLTLPPLFWGALLAISLFASIALHELAHSLLAIRYGGRIREITLMLIGGVSQIEQMPRGRRKEALMAAAGPATSLALFVLLMLLYRLIAKDYPDLRMGVFYLAHI